MSWVDVLPSTNTIIALKVYCVDRKGGKQTAFGYLGIKEGQLNRPAGILADDRWNKILLSECDIDRL